MHVEVRIDDTVVMLADGGGAWPAFPVWLHVYVPDVDAVVKAAVAAGAKVTRPVENQFYGDRLGTIEDPFGHQWHISTHVEDVTPDEMARRAAAKAGQPG
jgi:PhnB protein